MTTFEPGDGPSVGRHFSRQNVQTILQAVEPMLDPHEAPPNMLDTATTIAGVIQSEMASMHITYPKEPVLGTPHTGSVTAVVGEDVHLSAASLD